MELGNLFKRTTSPKGNKEPAEDFQKLLSGCYDKIRELKQELSEAKRQNEILQKSINDKTKDINDLRETVRCLRTEVEEQADALRKEKSTNNELKHTYLNLQEENELLVGRSSNVVSKLIRFCQLLKTMDIPSVEECIEIVKSEIEQSTTYLGFEIIDSYEGEFNPEIHCIIDTIASNDTSLNNHIAKVVRPGVWYKDKCLIPQDVIVYTFN